MLHLRRSVGWPYGVCASGWFVPKGEHDDEHGACVAKVNVPKVITTVALAIVSQIVFVPTVTTTEAMVPVYSKVSVL